ncbi:MAG: radical SAM protein, partial [Dehalococcoidales bacterium]|nr:radical SAM protein [Dehalococcoidales bacterium]
MPAVSKGSPEAESHFSRPEIIRPPSEWRSYYLPLTSGCANSTCTFCNYYGTRLKVREAEDVRREIDALALYMRSGIRLPNMPPVVYALARQWDGRRVFLQDGDALVYPYPRLLEVLAYLNERFPALERVACYATPQDILRRSPEELEALRKLKLGILYTGLESGSDEVLAAVGKGVTSREMVAAGRRVKDAGIVFSVSVILGLGGPAQSREHALATPQVLSEIDPEYVGSLT